MSEQKPQRVTITGGTVWIGLMLTIIAINTCNSGPTLERIERALTTIHAEVSDER